jgi:blue copper oxidase
VGKLDRALEEAGDDLELGTDFFSARFAGGDDTLDLLQVRAARTVIDAPKLPGRLTTLDRLDAGGAPARRFELSSSTSINGKRMDMSRIDAVVRAGGTEVWEVSNPGNTPHSFHPHGVSFRVLDYAGERPAAALRGSKDTVYVPPGETVRLLIRLPAYADRGTPYMFHCHVLEHEDRGMMGQFAVTDAGRRSGPAAGAHRHR